MLERTRQHLQAHQPCRIIERLSMKSRSDIQLIAKKLLEMQPSPVAHLRLLRDVLMLDPNHETIRAASKQVEQSRHVRLLRNEQTFTPAALLQNRRPPPPKSLSSAQSALA
jgi:hypothetical protein